MANFTIEVKGEKELQETLSIISSRIKEKADIAVKVACEDTANYIRKTYTGNGKGFKDRTGELRSSIVGGLVSGKGLDSVGHVSVGGTNIGSEGRQTKEYAAKVEFGEFSRSGMTAFLRPGVMERARKIIMIIKDVLGIDRLGKKTEGIVDPTLIAHEMDLERSEKRAERKYKTFVRRHDVIIRRAEEAEDLLAVTKNPKERKKLIRKIGKASKSISRLRHRSGF